nr:uncharacterized protein LOC129380157 [Dermacentor andersoni]
MPSSFLSADVSPFFMHIVARQCEAGLLQPLCRPVACSAVWPATQDRGVAGFSGCFGGNGNGNQSRATPSRARQRSGHGCCFSFTCAVYRGIHRREQCVAMVLLK